jgi:hypothetical protein
MKLFSLLPKRLVHFACNSPIARTDPFMTPLQRDYYNMKLTPF